MHHGILIVDKPAGPTSTDVLRILGRRLKLRKLGHGGTLDPFATGLLPVLVGNATRLLPFLHADDKSYRAVLRLGVATDTLDCTGRIVDERPVPAGWTGERFRDELVPLLLGSQEQRVPAFAAVRVDGEHLYEKARRGEEIDRPVRQVVVTELELEEWSVPELTLRIRCGTGTYIRSLAERVGELLGTCAHLRSLRRLTVGDRSVDRAVPLDLLQLDNWSAHLVPLVDVLPDLPKVELDAAAILDVRNGRTLHRGWIPAGALPGATLRLVGPGGELLAIGQVAPAGDGVRTVRGFPATAGAEL